MADVKWTRDQLDAIEARGNGNGGSFLISAAAGSGKTAVLVQRAIGLLTDPVHPVPADRLLVVTFTRAAAAEMRARLEKKLYSLMRENPGNEALRRQSILLSQASIGTMHSFCGDTIRDYFHELDISPEFKIITEKQEEELKRLTLDEAIGEMLHSDDGKKLADAFSGDRDDGGLASAVLQLYSYMSSHPFPRQWLSKMVAQYETDEPAGSWGRIVLRHTRHVAEHCLYLMNIARQNVMGDAPLEKAFVPLIEAESQQMRQLLEYAQQNNWQRTYETTKAFTFTRITSPKGYKDDPLKLYVQALRGQWKDTVEKKLKPLFPIGEAGCKDEFAKVGGIVKILAELTLDFSKRYSEKKAEKDFFDYNDLEHQMIRLVAGTSPHGDIHAHKTQAAHDIAAHFDEIMIDEFQDINAVQELIFQSVSKDGKNLFMVGDVKQSIYGFRQAMPEIFIRTRDCFEKYDRKKQNAPAYIVLGKNFRSRKTVTESVNFVFSQIMRRETGDLDYNSDEELVYGADYPEKTGCETELHFINKEEDMSITETEGRQIAARIWEMIQSGFTVTEQGQERLIEFRDFCVLLRSANAHAHDYAVELQKQGIPAKATLAGGFFAAREVGVILSFLRVISNPDQDIPLMTVLMSPIYGFTPDDLLALRQAYPDTSLYLAFLQAEEADCRYRQVARDIAYYRAACATMPSDGFIELLYRKTGYADMVLAMQDGGNRLANLQLLQKYAKDYEQSGYHGVAGFVRFMDRLKESRSDLQAAEQGNHVENSVRIMSVHKSKGLEFPVCFVAGCDRGKGNRAEQVLLHPELGLGIMLPDRDLGVKYRTVSRMAVDLDNRRRESAEEMRILYVAMTRAKEKLILISALKNREERLGKLAAQITPAGMSDYAIENAKTFAEWLLLCALRHPNGGKLREMAGTDASIVFHEFATPWQIELNAKQPEPPQNEVLEAEPALMDLEVYQEIKRAAAYRYPYQVNSEIPSKVTASGMAAKTHETRWRQPLARPAWLSTKGLTPAERGTALHDYMQYADFQAAAQDPQIELTRLIEMRFLSPEQGAALELVHVQRFLHSELGKRVLHAQAVEKERRFTVEVPAEQVVELPEESGTDTKVVLQGAVDCTFVEDEKIHIIDFKTDRVKAAYELAELYRTQIMLYAQAMEQVTGLEVGDCVLYSMHLDEAVKVEVI